MNHSEAGKKGFEKTKDILLAQAEERSQNAREKYEADPKFCPFCGEKIAYERRFAKFCNSSCSASYNNRGITRHIKNTKSCACGNPKKLQNKYCSECAAKHIYNRPLSFDDIKSDKIRRRKLIEKRGHRCEACGLDMWMGRPIPIELHHVDGNTDNNKENNLQLLCPNCHAQQAETHKSRNKNGQRQITRRKRYANGQTW